MKAASNQEQLQDMHIPTLSKKPRTTHLPWRQAKEAYVITSSNIRESCRTVSGYHDGPQLEATMLRCYLKQHVTLKLPNCLLQIDVIEHLLAGLNVDPNDLL